MSWKSVLVLALAAGCADKGGDSGAEGEGEGEGEGELLAVCEEATPVSCEDDLVSDLSYQEDISEGVVETTVEGDDFYTFVDATAGGYSSASSNPWTYVKFTPDGAVKVEISDEDSLESMDWDLAARRFILRLNGGDSGPSCVGAATLLESAYADVAEVPDGVSYPLDDFYTDDCTFVNDSSGLEGSPQVALSAWWEYPGCVATTGYPFLVQLADGHVIKIVIETYYKENQEICNESGSPPSDGGYIRFRWRYLK